MASGMNRRAFSQAAAVTTTALSLAPGRVLGANEQLRLGFIGVGNRGCQLLKGFLAQPDAKVVALCDVYAPYLNADYDKVDPRFRNLERRIPRMAAVPGDVARVKDFRAVLDRKDIDAVVIATPDHWHAIQMIEACKAGKDVYVEKPLSITIAEGRAMVDAARKHDRIVQVGTHRRSSRLYMQLAEVIRSGAIGKVTVARASYCSNMTPGGIGHAPPEEPPADLDWDLWLGPRPARPFQSTIDAVQVPLVAALFVAGGQLGRPLLRPHPLADRRAGPGVGLGPRRPIRRGRRPDRPRHHAGDLRARLGHAHRVQPLRGQRPARPGPRRRGRAPRDDGHALRQREGIRDRPRARRPVPGPQAQAQVRGRQGLRTATSTSRRPATSSTTSRAGSGPMPTSRRATAPPPSPTWRTSRWPPASGSTGIRRPST